MTNEEKLIKEIKQVSKRVDALWEATEMIRQSLPTCSNCGALIKVMGAVYDVHFCSVDCHREDHSRAQYLKKNIL